MPYPARALDPKDFATYEALRAAAFANGADAVARQAMIDYIVTAQAFSKDSTKSLLYAGSLNQPGRNVGGDIRIGPSAFEQDLAWLAGVVFHELVHSPQHAYYVSKGVTQIDPTRSETERRMIALDELEAYSWSLTRSVELALSHTQQDEIRRRAKFALIDLDDPTAQGLAKSRKFDAARDELIKQFNPKPAGTQTTAISRRSALSCYA
jgi:hypothetical protein